MKALMRIAVILGLCLFIVATVNADESPAPVLPCQFYGNVTINGLAAPAGTVITAYIDGMPRRSITTMTPGRYGGAGTYDPRLSILNGGEIDIGKTISFWANGNQANETAEFIPGNSFQVDLNILQTGPLPTAQFTMNITSGLAPFTVRFIDISDCVAPTGMLWNFGNGITSSVRDPVYTYLQPGIYVPHLTVMNSTGSNTTGTGTTITVFPKGDFNRNWRVDIGDVTRVAYMVVRLIPQDPRADFHNGNGTVEGGDAAKIAWYYVGKVPAL